jgi:hypothetical protein
MLKPRQRHVYRNDGLQEPLYTSNQEDEPLRSPHVILRQRIGCALFFGLVACCIATVALILGLFFPLTPTTHLVQSSTEFEQLINRFARTMTEQDIVGNVALFSSGATIDMHRVMRFLLNSDGSSPPPHSLPQLAANTALPPSTYSWGFQLSVFFPAFRTNHMTISNCNYTAAQATCTGYYTWTLDNVVPLQDLSTVMTSFRITFDISGSSFTRVEGLPGATSTLVTNVGSGVEYPGPLLSKRRKRETAMDQLIWNTLLAQINALVAAGAEQEALALCSTGQYQMFASLFDPFMTNSSLTCNTLVVNSTLNTNLVCPGNGGIDESCLPALTNFTCGAGFEFGAECPLISTLNTIPPVTGSRDFTLIGVNGIAVSGGMSSLTLSLALMIDVPPEFNVTFEAGMMHFQKLNQSSNHVYAAPASGVTGLPTFRSLVELDLPLVSLETGIYQTLSVSNGGTGNNASYVGNKVIVSSANGQQLVEGNLIGGNSLNITMVGNDFVFDVVGNNVVSVDLSAPLDIFTVTSAPVIGNGTLSFQVNVQAANTLWAGPALGSGVPTFRALVELDIPVLNASNALYGTLGVSQGGTGTQGPFLGSALILSNVAGNALVEGSLVGGTGISASVSGSIVTINNTGVTSVALSVPFDLFTVDAGSPVTSTGTLSFSVANQTAGLVWASPALGLGQPVFRALEQSDLPLINASVGINGVLLVSNGGTGLEGPLSPNRVILTNSAGTSMIESGALNDGQFVIGQSGTLPMVGEITSPSGEIIVTNLPGAIQLALSETLSATDLTVSGSTFLGNTTSCVAPLQASCYEISNQQCSMGALAANCIPLNLVLNSITANNLIVLNDTILGSVLSQEFLNVTELIMGSVLLEDSMQCTGNGTISQDCFSIAGKTCPMGMPVSESCIPANLIFNNVGVTSNLTINNLVCNGGVVPDTCVPNRIKSINGIGPNGGTLDFVVTSGTGITIAPVANGIQVSSTGVTSVGLAAPSDLFSVSSSPVTTTGTLTLNTKTQPAATVWAGPASGLDAVPSFRALQVSDLPTLGANQIYYGNGAVNLTSAGTVTINNLGGAIQIEGTGVSSIALSVPTSLLSVTGSPVTSSGTFSVSLANQGGNTVFASPANGANGTPVWRQLVASDLPILGSGQILVGNGTATVAAPLVAGTGISIGGANGLTISSTGVTSVGLALPSSTFDISGSPVTTTGALTGTLRNQTAHAFFAGPSSGLDAPPTWRSLAVADLPGLSAGSLWVGSTGGNTVQGSIVGSGGISVTDNGAGVITVNGTFTSIGVSAPTAEFDVTNSPLTANGVIAITKRTQVKNTVWAGPVSGADAAPTFRNLNVADLDGLGMLNGQLIIGSTGAAPVIGTISAGANIAVSNTPGGILISSSINGSAIGTVSSVALTAPASVFNVSGSPITDMGTLALSFQTQVAQTFFAGPASGGPLVPTFRAMTTQDLPALATNQIYIGNATGTSISTLTAGAGIGIATAGGVTTVSSSALVSSVALAMSGPLYSISGSPITTSGTLNATLLTQVQKTFFAGPASGADATPTFRNIALDDLPALSNGQIYIGQGGVPVASGLSAGTGIQITPGPGTITISNTMPGQTNTASNVGTSGVGVYKQKTGVNLEFKKLMSSTGSVNVVDDIANSRISLTVNESLVNHDTLLNYVANKHVDHSAVSINGATGIGGGGDLTASRTLSLDINSLPIDAAPQSNDYLLEYDVSASAHRRVLISSLPTSVYGSNYQIATQELQVTTVSTTFVQQLLLTTPSIPAGMYRISVNYEWSTASNSRFGTYRVQLDGSTTVHEVNNSPNKNNEYSSNSAFNIYTLTVGVHTVAFEMSTEATSTETRARRIRLEIIRIG